MKSHHDTPAEQPLDRQAHRSTRGLPPRGLIVLNILLLGALAAVTLAPRAAAQNTDQPTRPRGEYRIVGGEISGASGNALYILDSANREMVALLWDESRRQVQGLGYRDLALDLDADPER